MPTVAKRPSLKSTQAIGAGLLHQFARQRFIDAGVDEEWIQIAENREHLDNLASVLLHDEEDEKQSDDSTRDITISSTDNNGLIDSINSEEEEEGENDTTLTLQNNSTGPDETSNTTEQYVSLRCSTDISNNNLTTSTLNGHCHAQDNTVYHSIDGGTKTNQLETPQPTTTLNNLQSLPVMAFYGRELRKIADEFEKNRLRQVVKDRANDISLSSINKDTFIQLLDELFQGGITRERIVILFFFCTDVALRAVSFGQELVVKLIQWSFSYIINTVCKIVHSIGGWDIEFKFSSTNWDTVLFKQLPSVLISCCAAFGILALITHLNKSLRPYFLFMFFI